MNTDQVTAKKLINTLVEILKAGRTAKSPTPIFVNLPNVIREAYGSDKRKQLNTSAFAAMLHLSVLAKLINRTKAIEAFLKETPLTETYRNAVLHPEKFSVILQEPGIYVSFKQDDIGQVSNTILKRGTKVHSQKVFGFLKTAQVFYQLRALQNQFIKDYGEVVWEANVFSQAEMQRDLEESYKRYLTEEEE